MLERLLETLAELEAILAWDREYASSDHQDEFDRDAWQARRIRVAEIREELRLLLTAGGRPSATQ